MLLRYATAAASRASLYCACVQDGVRHSKQVLIHFRQMQAMTEDGNVLKVTLDKQHMRSSIPDSEMLSSPARPSLHWS